MFKNADNLTKLVAPPPKVEPEPYKGLVVPAGYTGDHTIAIQVAVTQWRGKVSGVYPNTMGAKAHRLDVTRLCDYDSLTDDKFSWLKTRIGLKSEDRVMRPDERHSVVMWQTMSGVDRKPWFTMYQEVAKAANYCRQQVMACKGEDQWALVMLVSINGWKLIQPQNPNWDPFFEAKLVGISDLEVVKLAPEPQIDLPDGFGLDDNGDPREKPEHDLGWVEA